MVDYKKIKSKFLKKWDRFTDKLSKIVIRIIAFIVNIDVSFIFIFLATYMFNSTYPLEFRLIGSLGLYVVYRMLMKDLKELFRGLKR